MLRFWPKAPKGKEGEVKFGSAFFAFVTRFPMFPPMAATTGQFEVPPTKRTKRTADNESLDGRSRGRRRNTPPEFQCKKRGKRV